MQWYVKDAGGGYACLGAAGYPCGRDNIYSLKKLSAHLPDPFRMIWESPPVELQWVLRRLDPQNSPEGNMTVAEVVALSDFVLSATNKPGETLPDSTDNLKSARASYSTAPSRGSVGSRGLEGPRAGWNAGVGAGKWGMRRTDGEALPALSCNHSASPMSTRSLSPVACHRWPAPVNISPAQSSARPLAHKREIEVSHEQDSKRGGWRPHSDMIGARELNREMMSRTRMQVGHRLNFGPTVVGTPATSMHMSLPQIFK